MLRRFRELFATDWVAHYKLDIDGLAGVTTSGPEVPRAFFQELSRGVRAGELGFAFSLGTPEQAQRDRAILFHSARNALALGHREQRRLGFTSAAYRKQLAPLARNVELHDRHGIADHAQLRILICDGPQILAYVNTLSARPITHRQQRLFRATTTLLRRRLVADHRLAQAQLAHRGLAAALEAIGRSGFIVDARGVPLHANVLGLAFLDAERDARAQFRDAIADRSRTFDVVRLSEPGTPPQYLLIRRVPDLAHAAAAIALEYKLGDRAREILLLAVTGDTTKSIAAQLAVAENTVDYHLTRLFRRFGVRSRVELQRVLLDRYARLARIGDFPSSENEPD